MKAPIIFTAAIAVLSVCNKVQLTINANEILMQKNECVSIIGKWEMVEYASGSVNALDALSFYKNGKVDCPPETGKFTYRFIKSDSLIIYNKGFGEQHYKVLKLSNDSLIKQIRRQKIYANSIDELVNGEIEKYIRVTNR